ncbi:PGPGW domain-containing protein [Solimonas marina]|uniref:Transmembrane protein (PGPGW) n=1 Tax=Solimonas marina TaxID=2714601 RepID=A0A970BBL6_9GAMM|nr:PGPGW domain-containing protein [Solimonas marina]NKF24576.1 hypothetical protein [Solimonas marina]
MFDALRRNWRLLKQAPAGERFQRYHEHRQHARRGPARRMLQLGGGAVITVIGVIMMPAPGPGTLVVIAGAALMAGESRSVARALDGTERRIRRLLKR